MSQAFRRFFFVRKTFFLSIKLHLLIFWWTHKPFTSAWGFRSDALFCKCRSRLLSSNLIAWLIVSQPFFPMSTWGSASALSCRSSSGAHFPMLTVPGHILLELALLRPSPRLDDLLLTKSCQRLIDVSPTYFVCEKSFQSLLHLASIESIGRRCVEDVVAGGQVVKEQFKNSVFLR